MIQKILNGLFPKYTHWYGNRYALSKIIDLPIWLCNSHLQHGIAYAKVGDFYLNNNPYYLQLVTHEREVLRLPFKKYIVLPPIPMMYFEKHMKDKSPLQKQFHTYFATHSTATMPVERNWLTLLSEVINRTPTKIDRVCIYNRDMDDEFLYACKQLNLGVVTAGKFDDPLFIDKLYKIIYSSKLVSASKVGSYTFYALYADIPFYIIEAEEKHMVIDMQNDTAIKKLQPYYNCDDAERLFTEFDKKFNKKIAQEVLNDTVDVNNQMPKSIRRDMLISTILMPITYSIYWFKLGIFAFKKWQK